MLNFRAFYGGGGGGCIGAHLNTFETLENAGPSDAVKEVSTHWNPLNSLFTPGNVGYVSGEDSAVRALGQWGRVGWGRWGGEGGGVVGGGLSMHCSPRNTSETLENVGHMGRVMAGGGGRLREATHVGR